MKFLAFDTSTDVMSIAVTDGERLWQHSGPGGARSSSTLIPALLALLADAGLQLADLDAIVFGRGPGSFSGLRTACAVAQGLAFGAKGGAGMPVLPVDTLMAVAEEARFQAQPSGAAPMQITALLDARIDEMYVQRFECDGQVCRPLDECMLIKPENLRIDAACSLLAGNGFAVHAARLPAGWESFARMEVLPTATALLRLAPALAAAGQCVDPALALPLYVRDKVALTSEERAVVKAHKVQALQAAEAAEANQTAQDAPGVQNAAPSH